MIRTNPILISDSLMLAGWFTKLMVVGGWPMSVFADVEVINLSGDGKTCAKPPNAPINMGGTGAYYDGYPIVCVGFDNGFAPQTTCNKYSVQVRYEDIVQQYLSILFDARLMIGLLGEICFQLEIIRPGFC